MSGWELGLPIYVPFNSNSLTRTVADGEEVVIAGETNIGYAEFLRLFVGELPQGQKSALLLAEFIRRIFVVSIICSDIVEDVLES